MIKRTQQSKFHSSLLSRLFPAFAGFLFLLLPLSAEVQGQTSTLPQISISTDEPRSGVEEGRTTPLLFNFTSSGINPGEEVEIELEISETGSFIKVSPEGRFFVPSGVSPPLEIELKQNNKKFEPDSTITVSIKENDSVYRIGTSSASVKVLDDDTPEDGLSIISVSKDRPITEGSIALFQVKSHLEVGSDTTVSVMLEDGGAGFLRGTSPQTVTATIDAGKKVVQIPVPTNDLDNYKFPNNITATITSATDSSGAVNFLDSHSSDKVIVESGNDVPNIPRASIVPVRSLYVNGETVEFRVTLAKNSQDNMFPQTGGIPVTVITSHSGTDFIDSTHQEKQTVQFSDFTTNTFSVLTSRSVSGMDEGMITVKIAEDPSTSIKYLPADSPGNSASVTLKHNTPKTVSITSEYADHGITEERPFTFMVTSTPMPEHSDLKVTLTGTGFGTLGGANPSPVVIPVGKPSTNVTMTTLDVPSSMGTGTFTVSVGTSSDGRYMPHGTNNSISVTVKDNDGSSGANPSFSIAPAATNVVNEGQPVKFTVTASHTPTADKTVRIQVSEMVPASGSYLASPAGVREFLFDVSEATRSGGSSKLTFSVPTEFERSEEQDGIIFAEILDGTGYTVASGMNNKASRSIRDFEIIPELSISPNKKRLTEGRSFEFTINADQAPVSAVGVNLNLSTLGQQGGLGGHTVSPALDSISIPRNGKVERVNFTAADVSGTTPLILAIAPSRDGSYTTPDDQSFSLELTIVDNDSPTITNPRFSIAPSSEANVLEGDEAEFVITSNPIPAKDVMLSLYISEENGSTAKVTGLRTLVFPKRTRSITYGVPTKAPDSNNDPDVDVTVEIFDGTGPDPDLTDDTNENGEYSLADGNGNKATVTVTDEDVEPEISIRSIESAVEEGFPARFEVLALDRVSSQPLQISVQITTEDGTQDTRMVNLAAEQSRASILEIDTQANAIVDSGRFIEAEIIDGEHYKLDQDPVNTRSRVVVTDNDTVGLPSVSISNSNIGTSIEEGWDALFTLSATSSTPFASLLVKIRIEDSGNYLLNANNGIIERDVRIGTEGRAEFVVKTVPDDMDEVDGTIAAIVLSDPESTDTYSVGAVNRAEVSVIDNDDDSLPRFVISSASNIREGEMASFLLVAANTSDCGTGLEVTIEISQEGNYLATAPGRRSPLRIGRECLHKYSEPTRPANNLNEPNGKIIARIVSDPADVDKYAVGKNIESELTVEDAEGLPYPSFDDTSFKATTQTLEALENSGSMTFMVKLSHESVNDVTVDFTVSSGTAKQGKDFEIVTQSPLRIPSGMLSAPIQVMLTDDNDYEWEEDFTIRLSNFENSRLEQGSQMARGLILDDEVKVRPMAELSAPKTVKESDGRFTVTVSITPPPQGRESITVNTLTAKDKEGEYYGGLVSNSVEIDGNSAGTGNFEILLREDDQYEGWGTITVTLSSTVNYTAPNEARETSIEVGVADAEAARVKISLTAESPISEGEEIVFVVKASPRPLSNQTLRIPITLEEVGTATAYLKKPRTMEAELTRLKSEQTLTFQTTRNKRYKGNVRIAITAARGDGYEVGSTGTPETAGVEVEITEIDEYVPEISIAAVSKIEEGNAVDFTISAYPVPRTDLAVRISSVQNANFAVWSIPDRVNLPKGADSIVLSVPTLDVYEAGVGNGSISVTIEESAGSEYHVSRTNGSSTVAVINNSDDPAIRYSIVETVITSILLADLKGSEGGQLHTESGTIIPEVEIATSQTVVEEGKPLVFTVSSDIGPERSLPVRIGLVQTGSFISGDLSRAVTLEKIQNAVELRLQTNDDEYAGEDGTVVATIQSGEGYSVGEQSSASVIVSDESDRAKRRQFVNAASQAVLPDLLANLGARTLQASDERFTQNFIDRNTNSFKFSGRSDITGMLEKGGEGLNDGSINWRSLLGDSSFSFDLFPEDGSTGSATVWGLGDMRDLTGNSVAGSRSWDGEAFTGHFGVESSLKSGYLTGLAVSVSESDVRYGVTVGDRLRFDAATNGLHPYLGFQSPTGEGSLQIIAGVGRTEVQIHQDRYSPEIVDGEFVNVGFKGSHRLYSSESLLGRGSTSLELAGQGWLVRQFLGDSSGVVAGSRMDAGHYRLILKGGHELHTDSGTSVTPTLSAGIRSDGNSTQSYRSLELGNGLYIKYSAGLSVSGVGGMRIADGGRLQHWEVQGRLAYDHERDGLGLLLETEPVLGWAADGNGQGIWKESLLDADYGTEQTAAGAGLESEIGYGFGIWRQLGVLTLTGGLKLAQDGKREFRFGNRIEIDPNFTLQLENTRIHAGAGSGNNKLELTGRIKW